MHPACLPAHQFQFHPYKSANVKARLLLASYIVEFSMYAKAVAVEHFEGRHKSAWKRLQTCGPQVEVCGPIFPKDEQASGDWVQL